MIFSAPSPRRATLSMAIGSIFHSRRNIAPAVPTSALTSQSECCVVLRDYDHAGTGVIANATAIAKGSSARALASSTPKHRVALRRANPEPPRLRGKGQGCGAARHQLPKHWRPDELRLHDARGCPPHDQGPQDPDDRSAVHRPARAVATFFGAAERR